MWQFQFSSIFCDLQHFWKPIPTTIERGKNSWWVVAQLSCPFEMSLIKLSRSIYIWGLINKTQKWQTQIIKIKINFAKSFQVQKVIYFQLTKIKFGKCIYRKRDIILSFIFTYESNFYYNYYCIYWTAINNGGKAIIYIFRKGMLEEKKIRWFVWCIMPPSVVQLLL